MNARNETTTSVAPKPSISTLASTPSPWQSQVQKAQEEAQGWQYTPPPSAPPTSDFADSHALAPGFSDSPVNPGWDSRPTSAFMDPGSWSARDERQSTQQPNSATRSAMYDGQVRPPRDQSLKRRSPSSKYSSQHLSARGSATTIDVPLFLQSPPFDPETAPPLPAGPFPHVGTHQVLQHGPNQPSHPSNFPSLPEENPSDTHQSYRLGHQPRRSLDKDARDSQNFAPQPKYDHQYSARSSHLRQNSQGSSASIKSEKRPRFDPQYSHESSGRREPRPDYEEAQPSSHPQRSSSHEPQYAAIDTPSHHVPPNRPNGSVSPVHDHERWPTNPVLARFDSLRGYVAPPEMQPNGNHQDGRSTTTTDASSNRPAVSTPESHQTSNTSYKGSDIRAEHNYDEDSNESFYWHSGRSSSEGEDEQQNNGIQTQTDLRNGHSASPAVKSGHESASTARGHSVATTVTEHRNSRTLTKLPKPNGESRKQSPAEYAVRGLPARSSSLSPNPVISYTASALGFGSPSDWEYFGDYEADEVDDEELYTNKPRAELPSDFVVSDVAGPPRLPELAEFRPFDEAGNNALQICSLDGKIKDSSADSGLLRSSDVAPDDGNVLGSKWSPSTTTPTTPHANSSRPITVTSEPLPTEEHRPDLDDVIRAWSDSPYVGRSSDVESIRHFTSRAVGSSENVAEASLASTPGENVLGIYAAPKDAPPLPKLPDPMDIEASLLAKKVGPEAESPCDIDEQAHTPQRQDLTHDSDDHTQASQQEPRRDIDDSARASQQEPTHDDESESPGPTYDVDDPAQASKQEPTHDNDDQFQVSQQQLAADDDKDSSESQARMADISNAACEVEHMSRGSTIPIPLEPKPQPSTTDSLIAGPCAVDSMPIGSRHIPLTLDAKLQPTDKAVSTNTNSVSPVGRTSSPSSDFARKRQMFEATSDKKPLPATVPRKTIKDLKISRNNSNVSEGTKSVTAAHERLTADKSYTSSNVSLPTSSIGTPSLSSKPSSEPLQLVAQQSSQDIAVSKEIDKPIQSSEQSEEPQKPEQRQSNPASVELRNLQESVGSEETKEQLPSNEIQISDQTTSKAILPQLTSSTQKPQDATHATDRNVADDSVGNRSENTKVQTPDRVHDDTKSHVEEVHAQEQQNPETEIGGDPYVDLDPWGRASLNRFAAMLREEARAEANKDKLNIFDVFASRESRLRVVLYGSDEELILSQQSLDNVATTPQRVKSQKRQHLANFNGVRSGSQQRNTNPKPRPLTKELPPLPLSSGGTLQPPISKHSALSLKTDGHQVNQEAQDVSEKPQQHMTENSTAEQTQSHDGVDAIEQRGFGEHDAAGAENFKQDSVENGPFDKQGIETLQSHREAKAMPITAPRSSRRGSGGEVKNYLTNRRSIYRPFATQTAESMENATNFGRELDLAAVNPPLPPIPPESGRQDVKPPSKGGNNVPNDERSTDLRRFVEADFDPLIMVLPRSHSLLQDSPRLAKLKAALDAVHDDFSFIHANVVSWDAKVKEQREENERQRHARQIESEQHIDALFDDHEIGYGDIAELEGEFKQSEATKKAEEDRAEFRTFEEDVFNTVTARLNYELDQLRPHYEEYSGMMNETLAGKEMFEVFDGLALAPMMTSFLGLHQKLEIRHQKAFEAMLERDRRLKKTEISPWYSLSNISKVKQLEKRYESVEKKAIIAYCEQRNARANRLMDILDQNTLRGVGANQDYMEAIMKAVRRIASGRAYASMSAFNAPTIGINLVEKAKATTAALAASSEQVVQTFHVADMLLNNADYEVSVAKAKMANDAATLNKLKEERAKEDQKLMRDLEHRLALIREDSRRTNDEIIKLMLFLGAQNGQALDARPAPAALGVRKEVDEQQASSGMVDPG